jgi:hypothetical protein
VLGLIHAGGLRFKDRIERAFQRQANMFKQAHESLLEDVAEDTGHGSPEPPQADILQALKAHQAELHFVAHFHDPLDIMAGDVGYITGTGPLRFVRLLNAYLAVSDGKMFSAEIQLTRCHPKTRWTREMVEGEIVRYVTRLANRPALPSSCLLLFFPRHTFKFNDSDARGLHDWTNGRPRIDKDFRVGTLNRPFQDGLVVDCTKAWLFLSERASELAANHAECGIGPSDLILGES